jgi:hypothetical protein
MGALGFGAAEGAANPSFLYVALSSDLLCGFLQGKPHEVRDATKFHRKLGDTSVYDRWGEAPSSSLVSVATELH